MNAIDSIVTALSPGTPFNQQNKVFRSAKALAQFAGVDQQEVLALVADNLADRCTIRPSAKRPENGPLIALTEFIPNQAEPAIVQIIGGNAVVPGGPEVELAPLGLNPMAAPEFNMPEVGVEVEVAAELMDEDDEFEEGHPDNFAGG